MDSRGNQWDSDFTRNSNSNGKERKTKRDRGGLDQRGSRGGSPSEHLYYHGGCGGDFSPSHQEDLYATNNNDYSKYNNNGDHFSYEASDYSHYPCDGGRDAGHYPYSSSPCSSPYDLNYNEQHCGSECTDSDCSGRSRNCNLPPDFPGGHRDHHPVHSECQGYSNCRDCTQGGSSSCRGPHRYGDQCDSYGTCTQAECSPSSVQVTAKVLFGSVSAISNLKQKKSSKK